MSWYIHIVIVGVQMDPAGLCNGPGICVRKDQVGVFWYNVCNNCNTESQKTRNFVWIFFPRAHARANIRAHAHIYPLAEMNTDAPILIYSVIIFQTKLKSQKIRSACECRLFWCLNSSLFSLFLTLSVCFPYSYLTNIRFLQIVISKLRHHNFQDHHPKN